MVVIGSAILPHGCLIFDGDENSESQECLDRRKNMKDERLKIGSKSLYKACESVAHDIAKLKPNLIILHTPHSIHIENSVGVILNEVAAGSAEWNGHWKDFQISLELDPENSVNLLEELRKKNITANGVTSFSFRFPAPLRWGQVVPLWFVEKPQMKMKYIIVTQHSPPKGLAREIKKFDTYREIGKVIFDFADNLNERVVFLISGDLSHKHQTDCTDEIYLPDPTATVLRTSDEENASKFDDLIGKWITQGKDKKMLEYVWHKTCAAFLDEATEIQEKALSCGLGGFHVLQGFLEELMKFSTSKSKLYEKCSPTYYGMLVAFFTVE